MIFAEDRLEQAIIELLKAEGYPHTVDEVYKEMFEQAESFKNIGWCDLSQALFIQI